MIRHNYLTALRHHKLRRRNSLFDYAVIFAQQLVDIESHAVSDAVYHAFVENSGRKRVKGKFTVFVFNGVTGVGTALKAYDNIRAACQHIRDFTFSLVAPVGSYNSFYHNLRTSFNTIATRENRSYITLYNDK